MAKREDVGVTGRAACLALTVTDTVALPLLFSPLPCASGGGRADDVAKYDDRGR